MLDGPPAYPRAIDELKESGELGQCRRSRTTPSLNNITEQDHHFIKKPISVSLGVPSADGTWRTHQRL